MSKVDEIVTEHSRKIETVKNQLQLEFDDLAEECKFSSQHFRMQEGRGGEGGVKLLENFKTFKFRHGLQILLLGWGGAFHPFRRSRLHLAEASDSVIVTL